MREVNAAVVPVSPPEFNTDSGTSSGPTTNGHSSWTTSSVRTFFGIFAQDRDKRKRKQKSDDGTGQPATSEAELDPEKKPASCRSFSRVFTLTTASVICLNAVYLGIETDYGDNGSAIWSSVDATFTIVFSIELLIRFVLERMAFFKQAWNYLDLTLVLVAILDSWVLPSLSPQGSETTD